MEVTQGDSGRKYITPEGNAYPSITTVLKILSEDSIKAWRKRIGEKEADKISYKASSRGNKIHEMAEKYINNDPSWKEGVMPNHLFTFNDIKNILDKNIDHVLAQEVPLYSDKFKIAGRVDCIAKWNNRLSIIDFKTSSKPKKENWIKSYYLQCAFYSAALFEMTGIIASQGVIIICVDNSEPQVFCFDVYPLLPELMSVRKKYQEINGV